MANLEWFYVYVGIVFCLYAGIMVIAPVFTEIPPDQGDAIEVVFFCVFWPAALMCAVFAAPFALIFWIGQLVFRRTRKDRV